MIYKVFDLFLLLNFQFSDMFQKFICLFHVGFHLLY